MASEREAPVRERAEQKIREIIESMRSEGPRYKSHDLGYVDSVSAFLVDEWADEIEQALSALPPVRAQEPTDRLCDCGHRESEHDDDYGQPCRRCSCINPRYGAETFEAVLNEAERVRAALPPVQATPTSELTDEQRRNLSNLLAGRFDLLPPEPEGGICAYTPDEPETPTPEPARERCQCGEQLPCQVCTKPTNEWLSTQLATLQSEHERLKARLAELESSPAPALEARVRALEETSKTALTVLQDIMMGHDGDEESGTHDQDCFACSVEAAREALSAALEGAVSSQETK